MQLSASGLTCVRGGRTVFAGIDFSVSSGEPLLVLGPNGAGKSSLLRVLAGLLRAAAGMLELKGCSPPRAISECSHYLGHQDPIKPALTAGENLRFWSRFLGGLAGVGEALETVGLGAVRDLPAGYLSAGQRRRLSLARLLAVERPIWLLDEPSSALDLDGQTKLSALMHKHLAGGGLIVAATHTGLGLGAARELRLESGGSARVEP
jgi:heme exporter protein A